MYKLINVVSICNIETDFRKLGLTSILGDRTSLKKILLYTLDQKGRTTRIKKT